MLKKAAINSKTNGNSDFAIYFLLSAPFWSAYAPIIGSVIASQQIEIKLTVPANTGFI